MSCRLILSCVTFVKTTYMHEKWHYSLSIFKIVLLYLAGCILIIPQCNLFQGYDSMNLSKPAVFQILNFFHYFIWYITFWFVSLFLHMESYAFTMKCLVSTGTTLPLWGLLMYWIYHVDIGLILHTTYWGISPTSNTKSQYKYLGSSSI
jgi:hypothetical protein